MLAFYDFPAEHCQHIWSTNPIESAFATVRHRTTRFRKCLTRPTFFGVAFKQMEEPKKSWRKIRGGDKIGVLLAGVPFKNRLPVQDNPPGQQKLAG